MSYPCSSVHLWPLRLSVFDGRHARSTIQKFAMIPVSDRLASTSFDTLGLFHSGSTQRARMPRPGRRCHSHKQGQSLIRVHPWPTRLSDSSPPRTQRSIRAKLRRVPIPPMRTSARTPRIFNELRSTTSRSTSCRRVPIPSAWESDPTRRRPPGTFSDPQVSIGIAGSPVSC